MYNLERIESVQFKTELKLKLENPFGVDKNLINFNYDPIINLIKQNIGLSIQGFNSSNIHNIFRFLTEHLFILISNEINNQFKISNFGQDEMIPLLTNAFILSLTGKNKIEKNIFDLIKENLNNLTNNDEKKYIFLLIYDLINISYSFNYKRKEKINKILISGKKNGGKTTLLKKIVNEVNCNNNINFYEKLGINKDFLLIDIPGEIVCDYTNNFFKAENNNLTHNFVVIERSSELIVNLWKNFITSKKWSEKNFIKLINNLINVDINDNDTYFINKTDKLNLNFLLAFKNKTLISFLKKLSTFYDVNTEELYDMNHQEVIFLISFIIKCGQYKNVLWGSLKHELNLNKLKLRFKSFDN